jgi:hypothetical protein
MIIPKSNLIANINNEIADNTEGKISPYDVRHNLLDIIDSVHLLLEDRSINSLNAATPNVRSVKVGEQALDKINLDGYFTVDNVAVGYSALKANYQGGKNTALGSQALNCNIYGSGNSAVGSNSLGGNTTGNGNVGLGNNTLINNKIGNFNVAIGHSAGYYANRNTNYKLFIASHPVDSDYICDNPLGSGLTPLVYGDLSPNSLRFGVAVNSLHSASTLQVSGGISPSVTSLDDIGHSSYRFKNIYLSDSINFPNSRSITYLNDLLSFNSSISPSAHRTYDLGSDLNQWKSGHFFDIHVSGTAYVKNYVKFTNCEYECKTLYLASSGDCNSIDGCGYLSDSQLDGAGFVVKSSGTNYLRDYIFVFRPSGNDVISLEDDNIYAKSHWNSNISIHLNSGNHINTHRIVGTNKLALVTDPSGYGLFLTQDKLYVGNKTIIPTGSNPSSYQIAGIGNLNFAQPSGVVQDYDIVFSALESGVDISQKFINGTKVRIKDPLNNNKDKLSGFELKYHDDSEILYEGGLSDRFTIRSFDNTSDGVNNIVLMKNNPNGGVLGVNNFGTAGDKFYPKTFFNLRSKDNVVIRATAESDSNGLHSALQLLGGNNCLQDGFETIYYHKSGIVDLNLYQNSGQLNIYRFKSHQAGLFSSGVLNATLTIGHSGFPRASISLRDNSFFSGPPISSSVGYGKIYNNKVAREYANQSHTLFFLDASGYTHDLTANRLDVFDARAVYSESFNSGGGSNIVLSPIGGGIAWSTSDPITGGNTFVGHRTPESRLSFSTQRLGNTALGTQAIWALASGDYNTAIGLRAGSGIVNGYENIIVGSLSALNVGSGYRNTVIGNNSFNNTSGVVHNNILIGNNLNNQSGNYNLLIGNSIILVSGKLGPQTQDKVFALPTSGLLEIYSNNNQNKLGIKNDSINVYNQAGTYPATQLRFNFSTPSGTNTLFTLDHSVAPSGSATYVCQNLPYAQINGNLRLQNNICFSDSTSLNSAKFLGVINNLEASGLNTHNNLTSLIVEGIALSNINNPSDPTSPTTGLLSTRLNNWQTGPSVQIVNRDKFLRINQNDYVVALKINGEYRPMWVSSEALLCNACTP